MELFDQLISSTTILTPNRRLSATLLKKHQQYQMTQKQSSWRTLNVLPFTSWIQQLWNEYTAKHIDTTPFILTTQHEQILWEEILQQSPKTESLLQLSATAELAKSAWSSLKQWRVDLTNPALNMTGDSSVFQQWAVQFQTLCAKNHWVDTHSLLEIVCEKIETKYISLAQRIIVIGFTELSPQQKHLFMLCEKVGTEVIYRNIQEKAYMKEKENEFFVSLSDEETEIRTMARWAKASLENHTTTLTIGCVVPHLENIRDRVSQIFSEVFHDNHSYSLEHTHLAFNISAGKSLSTYPIIHTALKLLNLYTQNISIENLSSLLRSPFIGEAEFERIKRATFDSRLRNANITNISIDTLFAENGKLNIENHCPSLAKRILKLSTQLKDISALLPVSGWVKIFMEILTTLGWPGERSLNSHEYQIVQRWLELLNEYRAFDTILQSQNYQNALHYLTRLTTQSVFQPQTNEAPIQILGILEAADLPFDFTWVMGLDDTTWPPSAKPNPFIPLRLQKILQMPHSSAERELIYSKRLIDQLRCSAKNIIFSHSLKNGDCELRPSSLITSFKKIQPDQIHLSQFISCAEHIYKSKKTETIHDEYAPSIQADEQIRGGVTIFKQQAACPFKAFAEIRLHARSLESPTIGLRSQDRGTITHKALELIWKEIKNSTALNKFNELELKKSLDEAISQAIQSTTGQELKNVRYLILESQRLHVLLWNWLQLEKTRPPFKVISQEQERTATIGKIPITLRVDRIDELSDGCHLIIDYKTGKNNHIKYWFSERPDEPQLPIYCITNPHNTIGIAFAEVHPSNLILKGISKTNLDIMSIKQFHETHYAENKDWKQQLQTWQETLEKIGNQFYEGNAQVDPKDIVETCRYCDLKALCRIHEDQAGLYE